MATAPNPCWSQGTSASLSWSLCSILYRQSFLKGFFVENISLNPLSFQNPARIKLLAPKMMFSCRRHGARLPVWIAAPLSLWRGPGHKPNLKRMKPRADGAHKMFSAESELRGTGTKLVNGDRDPSLQGKKKRIGGQTFQSG